MQSEPVRNRNEAERILYYVLALEVDILDHLSDGSPWRILHTELDVWTKSSGPGR